MVDSEVSDGMQCTSVCCMYSSYRMKSTHHVVVALLLLAAAELPTQFPFCGQ